MEIQSGPITIIIDDDAWADDPVQRMIEAAAMLIELAAQIGPDRNDATDDT